MAEQKVFRVDCFEMLSARVRKRSTFYGLSMEEVNKIVGKLLHRLANGRVESFTVSTDIAVGEEAPEIAELIEEEGEELLERELVKAVEQRSRAAMSFIV